MPRHSLSRTILTALVAAGCRDGLAPADLAGRAYALDRVGTAALPVVTSADHRDTSAVVADTITFLGGDAVRRAVTVRTSGRSGTTTTRYDGTLEFRVDGERVVIGNLRVCGDRRVNCAPQLVGTVAEATLELVEDRVPRPPAWRYIRVAD